ncbi:thioredoxin domain-containing protein [Streptomyces rimosus]|uniref:DsbA family protein n=1 Tax=Streptomyces rimosus TaxID=1927 RepID=UPI000518FC61|nr:thioredoxin domain-containing protein [Streptomyces rimosus]
MSQNNQDKKSSARERLQAQRAKEKERERRGRQLKVAGAVVVVLAVAGGIGVWAASSGDDSGDSGKVALPKGTQDSDKPAVPVGKKEAPSTLTVWEDFRCPACAQFEKGFRGAVHELEDAGQLKTDYHLATIIDGSMGGKGSVTAANAALCAQDAGRFREYHDVLYENQPPEQQDRFSDKKYLIQLAGKVDGLVSDTFTQCVNKGTYTDFVYKSNSAFTNSGYRGTPTVLLNGKNLADDKNLTPDGLKQKVRDAAKDKKAGGASGNKPSGAKSGSGTGESGGSAGASAGNAAGHSAGAGTTAGTTAGATAGAGHSAGAGAGHSGRGADGSTGGSADGRAPAR